MAVALSPKSDHRAKLLSLAVEMKFLSEDVARDLRLSLVNWPDDNTLVQYIISHHLLNQEKVNQIYARLYAIPYVEALGPVRSEVLSMVPYDSCTQYKLVPYKLKDNILSIALSDPSRIKENQPGLVASLHKEKKLNVELSLTSPAEYNRYIASYPHADTKRVIETNSPSQSMPISNIAVPPVMKDDHISIVHLTIDDALLHKVPLALAKRFGFVVVSGNGDTYTVASKDPANPQFKELIGYLEKANNIHLNVKKAAESEINAVLDKATRESINSIDLALVDKTVVQKVPQSVAVEYRFVVYAHEGNQYKVAAEDPKNPLAQKIWHYIEQHNHVTLSISAVDKTMLNKLLTFYNSQKPAHDSSASTKPLIAEPIKPINSTAPVKNTIPNATQQTASDNADHQSATKNDGWWQKTLASLGLRKQQILTEYLVNDDKQTPISTNGVTSKDPADAHVGAIANPIQPPVTSSIEGQSTIEQAPKPTVAPAVLKQDQPKNENPNAMAKTPDVPKVVPLKTPAVAVAGDVTKSAPPVEQNAEDDLGSLLEKDVTSTEELQGIIKSGYIPKMVAAIVSYAITLHASDVHIEAAQNDVRIRYRVDGMLQDIAHLPIEEQAAIVSRIKILSKLKIDETRIPQDGRFDVKFKDREVDLRVSSMPMVHGEKIVMRILDKSHGIMSLEDLGVVGRAFDVIIDAIKKPYGIILSTGPTGSGKSTTLYAILNRISVPTVNVITLEDPVEYEIAGVNQSQIKPKIGYTFAEGLRSVLRQDPNIIMVGEIRDAETASMATHSALTGHLVLSTLHTNDAPGALPRLINMGIEPFLITSSINVVEAQRLVRKTCQYCKEEIELPPAVVEDIKRELDNIPHNNPKDRARVTDPMKFYHGKGCERCQNGYKGRIGIYEVMPMSDKIEDLAVQKSAAADIQKQAIEEGMITMKQDGLLKALAGLTTIDEVMRETST